MKHKLIVFKILLVFMLLSAACAAQEPNNEPGNVTAMPTIPAGDSTATEGAQEAVMTPTGTSQGSTATEGAGEAVMTPTVAVDGNTPAPETGGAAVIPNTGPGEAGLPDDLDEVIRVLREAGATVELGDAVEQDFSTVPGQIIMINGEEVQIFTYASAEELEIQASRLAGNGDPEDEPHFYKMGAMLVRYVGSDPGVRDLLEDVLGAQAAGQ